MKPQRYAHSDGHTDLCYDETGRYILTCGADGDVRLWAGIECEDAISHRLGDEIYAIACKNGRLFTARDGNTIQAHTFPDGAPDGLVTRFTAPVTHMHLSASGKALAAGASDFTVKLVDTDNNSQKVFHGHEAPVLSVALDPKEEFLASASCDGTVKVWKVEDASCAATLKILPKCNDVSFAKTLCRLCWTHDGSMLLVPVEKEIRFYQRKSWEQASSFTDSAITDLISILAVAPDKTHIAAGCIDGSLIIVNLKSRRVADKHKHDKGHRFTAIAWNPASPNTLAYCDKEGLLGEVKIEFSSSQTAMFESDDEDLVAASAEVQAALPTGQSDPAPDLNSMPFLDDEDDPGDFMRDVLKSKALMEQGKERMGGEEDDGETSSIADSIPTRSKSGFEPTPLQRAFQPGSTPTHLQSRFMMWNSVGIVYQQQGEEDAIEVEFHDSAVHHPIHLTNSLDYCMADLSRQALALANSGDDSSPSQLMVMHFGSWEGTKEWTTNMPEGEEVKALVLGSDWVAVATSQRRVRVFTVSGIQRELISLPGPVVCMAAHQNQLMVIYHRGMALPGEQCMSFSLLLLGKDHSCRSVCQDRALPLSPRAALAWLGFSMEGTPYAVDSSGVVRMLNRKAGLTFVDVANTKDHTKGVSDHYWVIGVNESLQQIRCIPCKGSQYPATLPRPAVSVLHFKLPLCDLETEKGQFEEMLHRTQLLSSFFSFLPQWGMALDEDSRSEAERPLQEALMKMFALAVRCDREARAMDVCRMMPGEHILQLAIRYASRAQHLGLAQRISQYTAERASHRPPSPDPDLEIDFHCSGASSASYSAPSFMQEEVEEMEAQSPDVHTDFDCKGPKLKITKESSAPLPRISRGGNPFKRSTSKEPPKGTSVFDNMKEPKRAEPSIAPLPISIRPSSKKVQKKSSGSMKTFLTKSLSSPGALDLPSLDPKTISVVAMATSSAPASQESPVLDSLPSSQSSSQSDTGKRLSAFQLWMEANDETLQQRMADAGSTDLNAFAAAEFRALPKEDRQIWLSKAKGLGQKDNEEKEQDENKDSKRKRTAEDVEESEASPLSAKRKPQGERTAEGGRDKKLSEATNSKLKNFAFGKD